MCEADGLVPTAAVFDRSGAVECSRYDDCNLPLTGGILTLLEGIDGIGGSGVLGFIVRGFTSSTETLGMDDSGDCKLRIVSYNID